MFNDIDKVVKEVDKQPSVKYAQRLTPETSGDEHDALDFANKAKITRMIETLDTEESSTFPELDYFGQMHGTYLFAQGTDGLYIIDQHAAQERVKYEYYREKSERLTVLYSNCSCPIFLNFQGLISLLYKKKCLCCSKSVSIWSRMATILLSYVSIRFG